MKRFGPILINILATESDNVADDNHNVTVASDSGIVTDDIEMNQCKYASK